MEEKEILKNLKKYSPSEFEKFVLDFLLKIENSEFGEVSGKTGDEGIDGYIRLDKLGLSIVPFQAKRWGSTKIGRPEIQKFVGALHGRKVAHGVFVTTSSFTAGAREYTQGVETKIRLIDGKELVSLITTNGLQGLVEEKVSISSGVSELFEPNKAIDEIKNFVFGLLGNDKPLNEKIVTKKINAMPKWFKVVLILFLLGLIGHLMNPNNRNEHNRRSFNTRTVSRRE